MTIIEENTVVCVNCDAVGHVSEENRTPELGRPNGWCTAVILTNAGILTNSLLCDDCLSAVKKSLVDRRLATLTKQHDSEADASVAEAEASYLEHEKEIDALKAEEAQEAQEEIESESDKARYAKNLPAIDETVATPAAPVEEVVPAAAPPVEEVSPTGSTSAPSGSKNARNRARAQASIKRVEAQAEAGKNASDEV